VRRAVALGVAGVALVAPGIARAEGESATLRASRSVVLHDSAVRFAGRVQPAAEDIRVHLYRRSGSGERLIARLLTDADGRYAVRRRLTRPGPYLARASFPQGSGDPVVVESARVQVRIKPRLRTRFAGTARVGHDLFLRGRLQPTRAGVLTRRLRGTVRRVRLSELGFFRITLPTGSAHAIRIRLRLDPAAGYTPRSKTRERRLELPALGVGSRGPSVRALERLLHARQYALRGVNKRYGADTAQGVLAFQKVHGLSRTGRVTASVWRRLTRSRTPKARSPRGNHIEISKTHQVIYEVRKGKVVNVIHTSTGATGNTPVGTWRIYSKVPGYNASHMYYSLFFLRGFAIHGYDPVPAWPASHGCARIPLWIAPGLYSRWDYGSKIIVFS
jgi:Putative peptidoglycan binding domain/L,D-transpeptidase catalytic domain